MDFKELREIRMERQLRTEDLIWLITRSKTRGVAFARFEHYLHTAFEIENLIGEDIKYSKDRKYQVYKKLAFSLDKCGFKALYALTDEELIKYAETIEKTFCYVNKTKYEFETSVGDRCDAYNDYKTLIDRLGVNKINEIEKE